MIPVPSLALLRSLRSSLQQQQQPKRFCRACAAANLTGNHRRRARRASTYTSHTAVTATKSIPAGLQRLYDALEAVKKDAPGFTDLSRLQLALRGLETSTPAIRVAFLGLNGFTSVRLLARTLLADPLSPTAEWEQRLGDLHWSDNRSLLLRYGDDAAQASSSAILAVQHVPCQILREHNIEILLSTLPSADAASIVGAGLEETVLVPLLGTPMSFSGNVSLIRHPVHRSLLLGEGLAGCAELGGWFGGSKLDQNAASSVQAALNFRRHPANVDEQREPQNFPVIDLEQAVEALALLRKSNENAAQYADGWQKSGVGGVVDWFVAAAQKHPSGMPVAVHRLIEHILSKSDSLLGAERAKQAAYTNVKAIAQITDPLKEALERWATKGHVELRDGLDNVVMSKDWAKLRWWKLFWRVDDVGMILSQVVERSWLPSAGKGLTWLHGRFFEARLMGIGKAQGDVVELQTLIEDGRQILLETSVPKLHSLAQALVVQTASMTTLASAFAALVYWTWPVVTVVQASAFAALGFTWSLHRMQGRWEEAREAWLEELREEGRQRMQETEERLQSQIEKGSLARVEEGGVIQDLDAAQAVITAAREALQQLDAQQHAVGAQA